MVVTQVGGGSFISTDGTTATLLLALTKAPAAGKSVTVFLNDDEQESFTSADARFTAATSTVAAHVTFDLDELLHANHRHDACHRCGAVGFVVQHQDLRGAGA